MTFSPASSRGSTGLSLLRFLQCFHHTLILVSHLRRVVVVVQHFHNDSVQTDQDSWKTENVCKV